MAKKYIYHLFEISALRSISDRPLCYTIINNSIFLILLIILSRLSGLPFHLTPQQHSRNSPFPRAIKRPACSLPQVSHKWNLCNSGSAFSLSSKRNSKKKKKRGGTERERWRRVRLHNHSEVKRGSLFYQKQQPEVAIASVFMVITYQLRSLGEDTWRPRLQIPTV